MDRIFPAIPLAVTLMILGLFSSLGAGNASVGTGFATARAGSSLDGLWRAKEGRAYVRISRCAGGLCNHIAWLKQDRGEKGEPLRDSRNLDPLKRHRKILGLPILTGMKPQADGSWKGRIYDPEQGRTFTAYLKVLNKYHLELKGCLGETKLCRTYIWQRVN